MKPHNEENPEVGGFRVRYNRTEIRDLSNENTTPCAVIQFPIGRRHLSICRQILEEVRHV